ncbi:MAG: amino acid adenylation domain-containing protein [Xenococcaceae cyanobacterium MO_188.B32]|nr:amino acid adenylation domain-containing protein [Xenococcaceae cyanobacterium MO_188.B32]
MSEFSTLVDILHYRSRQEPNRLAYIFLQDGEKEARSLTYQELEQQVQAVANRLRQIEASGSRALLLYPPSLEYIIAFFGCLSAGVVAVPAYPPRRNNQNQFRLQAIAVDAQANLILTTTSQLQNIKDKLGKNLQGIHYLATDNLEIELASHWHQPIINSNSLAFLQYTSGSTGTPKGVMVSHKNIMHNLAMINQCFGHSSNSKGVIWLPPYHDMGLIGGILQPIFSGFSVVIMPPVAFLQKPFRWLQAISRYKATTSGGPNFAYDLCVKRIKPEQLASIDLSSWEIAFNGSESVNAKTLDRFVTIFKSCGFRREAFYPCYGMAETTLIASGGSKTSLPVLQSVQRAALEQNRLVLGNQEDIGLKTLVGCGQSLKELRIIIAHPDTLNRCSPEEVGEIWVAGASVTQGYWNRPEETEQTFQAYLADSGEGPFFRTGDLGFLKNGELFITGRLKELIVIRGHNYYPQDIEWTVQQSHSIIRNNCGAAFSIEVDTQEWLVIVQEVERNYRKFNLDVVANAIRQTVAQQHGLQVYAVLLLKTGSIPKTSSGKIQRYLCRAKFIAGTLNEIGSSYIQRIDNIEGEQVLDWEALLTISLQERLEQKEFYLQQIIADVMCIPSSQLTPQQPLTALGLDSLQAFQIIARIQEFLAVEIPSYYFFESKTTIATLSGYLESEAINKLKQEWQVSIINPGRRDENIPISYTQRGLWFLNQLITKSPAYNLSLALNITGNLNTAALEQAIREIIRRHEILRTTFKVINNSPVQVIASDLTVPLTEISLHLLPLQEQSLETQRIISEEIEYSFDLSKNPPLRITLMKLGVTSHIMLLVMHHIIADGWSQEIFIKELNSLYTAFSKKEPSPLPELSIQYADFVQWQRQKLSTEHLDTLLKYWRRQLVNAQPLLNLPTDRVRPPVQTYRGQTISFVLDANLSQQLKTLSQQAGATLYMFLLTVFVILLFRYCNQEDIIVGSPIAGRNHRCLEPLIGFFVNVLALRIDVSGNPTFLELLQRVRQISLEAYAHQELPFEKLIEELQPKRSLSYTPLFQVMFVLQNSPIEKFTLSNLTVAPLKLENHTSKFDLTLSMTETEQRLMGEWQYNRDLFDAATITRMAGHFQTLLTEIVANPEQRVANFSLLTPAEQHQLLFEWNDTQTDYPQDKCIHQLFEEQVEKTPDAVAVVFENQQLTYQQLNQRANQLAHHLQSLGVRPEVLVGICVERSLEMVVGLLGILKAGGAYVPLDSNYPHERLNYMLEDSGVQVLLTQQCLLESLPSNQAQLVCLDTNSGVIEQLSQENLEVRVSSDNLADLIYTSGSTGVPKGVSIIHQGVVRLVKEANYASLTCQDVFLQLAPISFDASTFEIWGSLLNGAKLVVMYAHTPNLEEIAGFIEKYQVTTLWLTAALFHLMVEQQLDKLKSVRQLLAGGDILSPPYVEKVIKFLPECQLINGYGPTENTTFTCCYLVKQSRVNGTSVPIGRPISNTQIYILNKHLQPVPIGVTGELYIGGDGLARGYFNRPELTSEKFIPNPFKNLEFGIRHCEKLYKTGDLARYLPDGNIEFLGRIDNQIKIRGFRIELGEIEAVLNSHPQIQQAVVIATEEISGNKRLLAYLVTYAQAITINQLREFLKQKLPEYMVPSTFVTLDTLPLTPNGKVDRKALPAPDREITREYKYVPPRTPIEKIIANIFASVLGIEAVGINDNFFELGGHSLLAIRVISRLRTSLSIELPLQSLFEFPTVADLAKHVETVRRTVQVTETNIVAIHPRTIKPLSRNAEGSNYFPLSIMQQPRFLLYQVESSFNLLQQRQQFNQNSSFSQYATLGAAYSKLGSFKAYYLKGELERSALEQSLNAVVERHESLRTTFVLIENQVVQKIATKLTVCIPIVDLSNLPQLEREMESRRLAKQEDCEPFDLQKGPLFRAKLLKLSETEYIFFLNLHHIIMDGRSIEILIRELELFYESLIKNHSLPSVSPLPIQYGDFASWQQNYIQGQVLKSLHTYWEEQLSGVARALDFPTDYPRSATFKFQAASQQLKLSKDLVSNIKALSTRLGVTLFMLLLAALQISIHSYTENPETLITIPIEGRNHVETKDLIGLFSNGVVLRTNLSGDPTFNELLGQVRQIVLGAFEYQSLPYMKQMEILLEEHKLSFLPLLPVSFNYIQHRIFPPEFCGLKTKSLNFDREPRAGNDISLFLYDEGNEICGQLTYNNYLFRSTTATKILTCLQTVLANVVINSNRKLSELSS